MRLGLPVWLVLVLGCVLGALVLAPADASTGPRLKVYVGYMDTHTMPMSRRQPHPWPYRQPRHFVGSPCAHYGTSIQCWDASAVRLDNRGPRPVRVHVTVLIGRRVYDLWGRRVVRAGKRLVLTETGARNSQNFDGSDFPPNDYDGGNRASCENSGAIPRVRVQIGRATRVYRDRDQVLNTGGVDAGHCRHGHYVAQRRDESRPWSLIRTFVHPSR
jgi:hypothetical protein